MTKAMTEDTAPAITGIHHLSVTIRDIEASVACYQRLFRAERVPMKLPHYEREDKPVMVCCSSSRARGLAIGLHTNTGNDGAQFDEARTGLDQVGFHVGSREELDAWIVWLEELGIEHSAIRTGDEPFPYATVVFRDPDNIQLELFTVC